jgi:RPA family protein
MAEQIKRQVAVKLRIVDILNARYIKKEGWQPNVITVNDHEISRVNVIATVVTKPEPGVPSIVVDDGSGKIVVRSFDEPSPISRAGIGDVILLIGRPREFNSERYVIPEIIRKIENPKWIELRLKELAAPQPERNETAGEPAPADSLHGKICDMIRKYDSGNGADYQQIVDQLNSPSSELAIEQLLEQGEIFEIRPGKLKVLD